MSPKYIKYFLIVLITVVAAKRDRQRESRERSHSDDDKDRKAEDGPTTTTGRSFVGDAVVEKFVETLMASERYLKLIETVERKLNHLDATFHEKSNGILKYVSETLRVVKTSPLLTVEKALIGMKDDLDRLKQSVTLRLNNHPNMRGKYITTYLHFGNHVAPMHLPSDTSPNWYLNHFHTFFSRVT